MAKRRYFQPARMQTGGAPETQEFNAASGQAFIPGAVLILSAAGEVTEAGADPADGTVIGVAATRPGYGPGINIANSDDVVQSTHVAALGVSVIIANRTQIFSGLAVTTADAILAPAQSYVGDSYGIKKLADGTWVIDTTDTTNTDVNIVDVDTGTGTWLFKFRESILARP